MQKNRNFNISINEVLLSIYLFIVWSIYLFVNYYTGKEAIGGFLWLSLIYAVIIFSFSKLIISAIRKLSISHSTAITTKRSVLFFCIFFLSSFAILCLWYIAYYPGAYPTDALNQYVQATTGNYNDWHPVWHTLIVYSLPLAITGKTASIALFQILYFALILGYMALTIYQYANLKAAVIALGYILLNPYTGCIAIFPWKDVAMSITLLWLTVCIAKVYYTNGQWALKKGHTALVAFLLANATLFRHNAILFTLPLALTLIFYLNRKKWLELILLFFVFIFIVKVPVYTALDVEKPDKRHLETMGLPLTVIANVAKEYPASLDEKTARFVYQIASQETWEKYYVCGNFNSIKWNDNLDLSIVEETGIADILKMTVSCFKTAPQSSCMALFTLTDMVYSTEGELQGDFLPRIHDNDLGITSQGNETLRSCLLWYREIMSITIFKYIRYIGISILIMLAFILGKSNLKKWSDWRKILLCIPIFLYDFGTMLLLTGNDSRFFYVSFLICPMVVLIMIKEENFKCEKN